MININNCNESPVLKGKDGLCCQLGHSETLIGRNSNNHIVLSSKSVSGRHAKISQLGNRWLVKDLGSTNGTYVNGTPVTTAELHDEDEITFGAESFVFINRVDGRSETPFPTNLDIRSNNLDETSVILQSKLGEHERKMTEAYLAGGMAHEIRNSLGATKLRLYKIVNSELNKDISRKLEAILSDLKDLPDLPSDVLRRTVEHIRFIYEANKKIEKSFIELNNSTERGLQVANRVVDYSKLDLTQDGEEVNLSQIIGELASTYQDSLAEQGIKLSLEVSGRLIVKASNSQIHSLFQNLILNARDAIIEKGESIGAIKMTGKADTDRITIEVHDNGSGIAEENLDMIFRPFYSTKPTSGIGLGLSECQKIVRRYGGKIDVQSEVGIGTKLIVTLPIKSYN